MNFKAHTHTRSNPCIDGMDMIYVNSSPEVRICDKVSWRLIWAHMAAVQLLLCHQMNDR